MTTPSSDQTAAVDRLARVLCDVDQADVPPERRETLEQTGGADDFREMARVVLDWTQAYWRDRIAGEIATQRVTHVPAGREAYGEGWNDAVAHLAAAARGGS